jgi:hypothetical protein
MTKLASGSSILAIIGAGGFATVGAAPNAPSLSAPAVPKNPGADAPTTPRLLQVGAFTPSSGPSSSSKLAPEAARRKPAP